MDANVGVVVVVRGVAVHGREILLGREVSILEGGLFLWGRRARGVTHDLGVYAQGVGIVVGQVGGRGGTVGSVWTGGCRFLEGPLLELRGHDDVGHCVCVCGWMVLWRRVRTWLAEGHWDGWSYMGGPLAGTGGRSLGRWASLKPEAFVTTHHRYEKCVAVVFGETWSDTEQQRARKWDVNLGVVVVVVAVIREGVEGWKKRPSGIYIGMQRCRAGRPGHSISDILRTNRRPCMRP